MLNSGKYTGLSALLLLMLIVVSGCGFHLRGTVPLPEVLKRVYIVSDAHSIRAKLSDAITSSGGAIVNSAEMASAVITVYSISKGRDVKSVSGQGRVREYTIRYAIEVGVKTPAGKILLPKQHVMRSRDIAFTEAEVVGKAVEESIILTELEREMIPTILHKLQHISTEKKVEQAQH